MWDFVQSYGFWIVFAVLFFFMMRAHGHGGGGMHRGCGTEESRKPGPLDRKDGTQNGQAESDQAPRRH